MTEAIFLNATLAILRANRRVLAKLAIALRFVSFVLHVDI